MTLQGFGFAPLPSFSPGRPSGRFAPLPAGSGSGGDFSGGAPLVKVCGVRTPEIAVAVAHAGADLIGVNFAQVSKRRVDLQTARQIAEALTPGRQTWRNGSPSPVATGEGLGRGPLREGQAWGPLSLVGIFVEQSADQIAAIASEVGLDAVQLSGDCTPTACAEASLASGLPVIAVMRLGAADDLARATALAQATGVAAVLVDAPNTVGGAGHAWDHSQARPVVGALGLIGIPVIVAGGLNQGNVRAALESSAARGVDVASGVETDAMTDPELVRDFVRAAHARRTPGNG